MPATQLRTVDQIVVHQRRRMHQLDSDRSAYEPFLALLRARGPAGRLCREHDKQRSQSLAAGAHRRIGVRRQRLASARRDQLEVALGAPHALAQLLAATAHDRVDALHAFRRARRPGAVQRVHPASPPGIAPAGTVPAWIATIPPASST